VEAGTGLSPGRRHTKNLIEVEALKADTLIGNHSFMENLKKCNVPHGGQPSHDAAARLKTESRDQGFLKRQVGVFEEAPESK